MAQQASLILIDLAGTMKAAPNAQKLQGQVVLAISVHVERMSKFRWQGCVAKLLCDSLIILVLAYAFLLLKVCYIIKCIFFIRYKVVVQVVYEGDKSEFVFWDKECVQILGVTADTLRKTMQEVNLIVKFSFGSTLIIY